MKKHFLLLIIITSFVKSAVMASGVSVQTASTIALNFYKVNMPGMAGNNITAVLNYTQRESDGVIDFYIFNLAPVKGFVIVSANDNAEPVIAYSTESYFISNNSQFGLGDWIKSSSAKLHEAVLSNRPASAEIAAKWNAYLNGQNPVTSRAVAIGPLCTTTWNQEPYYNALCPFNTTDNQRALTGCVATAMAQIMKYWNYPASGTGSYSYTDAPPGFTNNYGLQSATFGTYNWAAMPNAVTSNTSPVDTLMYHCAVSVAMDFGDDNQNGSGAFVLQSQAGGGTNPCAQYSYATYFKYNPTTLQGVRMSQYSTPDWINLMENEINSGRVIQYEGDDPTSGGHTWVCDGYETNGMLHMNWGWGGAANGYFAVGNLNAGGYTFSQNDGALIGIEPMLPITLGITTTQPAICPGGNTTLTANGPANATYTWTPSTGLSCTTCASPVATPAATTLYHVTADSAGIQATTSLAVVITQPATANFTQIGIASCTLPEKVNFTNTSTNSTTYVWDFGDGIIDSTAEPIHTYANQGLYTVKLYAANACGSDSLVKNQAVNITSGPPASSDQNICAGQTVMLHATGLGIIGWFVGPGYGASELATGPGYTTPVLHNTTTYYIGSSVTPAVASVGPVANTVGTGSYYTRTTKHGMLFNNTTAQKLVSVDVYTDTAGVRSIVLSDSAGNTLDSLGVSLTSGHHTVALNWQIPAANRMMLSTSGFNYLYRNNSGVTFPYTSTDGTITITGNNAGSPGSFYFYYNWKFQQSACQTARTPVTVFVLGSGGNSIIANGSGTPAVNFAPADTNGTSYEWSFGDGNTSTSVRPQHTYAANGTYTVQLIVSNGTCSDTTSQTISTVQLGVNEVTTFTGLDIFPNPAKDQLNLNLTAAQTISNCRLSIRNILGETVYTNATDVMAGVNNIHFDISHLASGIYILTIQNGKELLNERFVKGNE